VRFTDVWDSPNNRALPSEAKNIARYCSALFDTVQCLHNNDSNRAVTIFIANGGPMTIIKVSSESRTSAVAGAIAGVVRENNRADVQAIGAGAVNQAVKAIAIARGYLQEDGLDVVCIPEFTSVDIDGKERTAIRLVIEPR
jgi:stage V sporulation protein S